MNTVVISNVTTEVISYQGNPVVTTKQLAEFYGSQEENIRRNFSSNKDRFEEGKHFFKLTGKQVSDFVALSVSLTTTISQNSTVLMLWTEKGAARHAKMLSTEKAWEVFEQLEDSYFRNQSSAPETFLDALKLAVSLEEKKQAALRLVSEKQKQIENKDTLIRASNEASVKAGEILVREFVKSNDLIDVGEHGFWEWMRNKKIVSASNEPYGKFVKRGYFTFKPSESEHGGKVRHTLRITPRGKVWLAAEYLKHLDAVDLDQGVLA